MSGWTDEKVERVKALYIAGRSASQIAKEIGGVTRNAVIGIIYRKNFGGAERRTYPRKTNLAKVRQADGNRVIMRMKFAKKEKPQPAPKPEPAIASNPVRFLDLRFNQCAAILDDAPLDSRMCCGNPVEPESAFRFCPAHKRIYLVANAKRPDSGKYIPRDAA